MANDKRYYNERAYVILAQRDDGTYIGDNGIANELNRVYIYKPSKLFDEVKESQRLKSSSKFKLRKRNCDFSASRRVDAYTNPTSNYQCEWFFVREIVKQNNKNNHLGCSNWRAYRLNSKHCPITIDMEYRRKIFERKVKYDNVEFFNPKFVVKNAEKLNLLKQQYNDEVSMFERWGGTNIITFTDWLNFKNFTL